MFGCRYGREFRRKYQKTHTKCAQESVPYVALPHLRDTNLGDKQEKTPTHKEAH